MTEQQLTHFGIKGMKWGVRRYQNEDGTLTSTGKQRMEADKKISDEANRGVTGLKSIVSSVSSGKKANVKSLDDMTDDDLKKAVNRMNLEQQYNNLNSAKQSRGEDLANSILSGVGGALTVTSSALGIALAIKNLSGN